MSPAEGTGAAEMTSYVENSQNLKPQEHFPEVRHVFILDFDFCIHS